MTPLVIPTSTPAPNKPVPLPPTLTSLADDLEAVGKNTDLTMLTPYIREVVQLAAKIIREQQYMVIGLEVKVDDLTKRNNNQAKLIDAIDRGTAKRAPGGGWYKENT